MEKNISVVQRRDHQSAELKKTSSFGVYPLFPILIVLVLLWPFWLSTFSLSKWMSDGSANKSATYYPRGGKLDPHDYTSWLVSRIQDGCTLLVLAAGNYSVTPEPSSRVHLQLQGPMRNIVLDMSGVNLWMSDRYKTAMAVSSLTNVTIRGLSIYYETFPTNQATVTAIGEDGKSVDVEVHEAYPLEDWQSGKSFPCYVFNPKTRWWKHGSLDMYSVGVTPLAQPRTFRLHYDGDVGPGKQPIAEGDLLGCRQAGGAFTVQTTDSVNTHWEDVTLYGGPGFGFFEGGISPNIGGNTYLRCSVRRPPKPAGATEDGLLSTSADGFHSSGVSRGPTIDSCYFEAMPDDGIAIHGRFSLVTDADTNNHQIWLAVAFEERSYDVGDVLHVYDRGFNPAGLLTIMVVQKAPSSYKPPHNVSHSLFRLNLTTAHFLIITVKETVPAGCSFDYIVADSNRTGNSFLLRNNTVYNHRARGMLIKASNGVIINNTIDGSSLGGIVITPELYWAEADYTHNITITNNRIANIAYIHQGVGGLAIGAENSSHRLATGYGHSHIIIKQNLFVNISFNNVWISSVEDLTFANNSFHNSFIHTPWASCCLPTEIPADTVVFVTKATQLSFSNNCVYNPGSSVKSVFVSTQSATGTGLQDGVHICT